LRIGRKRLLLIAVLVVAGVLTVYLAGPLFYDVTVHETLPEATGASGALYIGTFRDADDFHRATGTVQLLRNPDGTYLLRFEAFRVTNGPDLFVYLAQGEDVNQGFIDLGRLKGNVGDQNYDIPPGVDPMSHRSVVIWCRAFAVPFGYASLSPA
jgi:hypothetical protein